MPRGLKRYQQAGGLHFITFNCGVPHSRPSFGLERGIFICTSETLGPDEIGMAWSGGSAGAMAVEQLPRVRLPGKGTGPSERVGRAETEVSATNRFPVLMLRLDLETRETRGPRRPTKGRELALGACLGGAPARVVN